MADWWRSIADALVPEYFKQPEFRPPAPGTVGKVPQAHRDIADMLIGGAVEGASWATPAGAAKLAPGALAIFAGPMARTANKAALSEAEKLAASGATRDAIWNQTGWFKGVDDKWRFEIPDNTASIKAPLGELTNGGYSGDVRGLMSHLRLFRAYPDTAKTKAVAKISPHGGGGAFGPVDGVQTVYASGDGRDSLLKTSLHELQHATQKQEGFARGGSPGDNSLIQPIREMREKAEAQHEALFNEMRAFQDANATENSGTEYLRLMKEWKRLNPEKAAAMDASFSLANRGGGPRLGYQHLAGEVEARNVQKRMDMTPEQRRATPPWATQDIPDEQQIIRFLDEATGRGGGRSGALGNRGQNVQPPLGAQPEFTTPSVGGNLGAGGASMSSGKLEASALEAFLSQHGIPFAKQVSGNISERHGPSASVYYRIETPSGPQTVRLSDHTFAGGPLDFRYGSDSAPAFEAILKAGGREVPPSLASDAFNARIASVQAQIAEHEAKLNDPAVTKFERGNLKLALDGLRSILAGYR